MQYNSIQINYCDKCNKQQHVYDIDDVVIHFKYEDELTYYNPDILLLYDTDEDECTKHTLLFEFNYQHTCDHREYDFYRYSSKEHLNLCFNVRPPNDKSLYNVDVLLNKDNKYDTKTRRNVVVFDCEESLHVSIAEKNLTDEQRDRCDELLLQTYNRQLVTHENSTKLIDCINETLPDDVYYMLNMICDLRDETPLFIYVEKDHVVYYVQDVEIFELCVVPNTDYDVYATVEYGYGIHDIFKLPDILEVDDVEYVRIYIGDIFKCRYVEYGGQSNEYHVTKIKIFTTGRIISYTCKVK